MYLAVFKIVFWIAAIGWGLSATTLRLFLEKISSGQAMLLKEFANDGINVEHLKTEELELDTSLVPPSITVSDLEEIFLKINFTDRDAPGYMPPTTRKEADRTFTRGELKEHLSAFIRRVNRREAFLGTPPSYDFTRLMDFYQQIEDAVRLSIYKTVSDVNEFERVNGTNYLEFSERGKNKYNDLLEARARVALDLAIAGAHCGARYMGEATDVYYNVCGKDMQSDKDLRATLLEILAEKRKEIAIGEIQRELGANVHGFTNYMSNMGKLVGIPGTKNVVEHLSGSFNTHYFLDKFFQAYTVDAIIDAVQEKIKTSQSLREKITDWIRDQVEDWNRKKYVESEGAILQRMEEIRNSSSENIPLIDGLEELQSLLSHLKEKKVPLPEVKENWNDFIEDLFSLEEAKKKLNELSKAMDFQEIMSWRNKLKLNCFEKNSGLLSSKNYEKQLNLVSLLACQLSNTKRVLQK